MGFEPTQIELSGHKFMSLSEGARALWFRAGFWCDFTGERLVSIQLVKSWLSSKRYASELATAGLWVATGDLWTVSEFGFHEPPSKQQRWDTSAYLEVYDRDGRECRYCYSSENLSIDHVVSRRNGGSDDTSNLVVACRKCNSRKGSRSLEEAGMQLLPSRIAEARARLSEARASAGRLGGEASASTRRSKAQATGAAIAVAKPGLVLPLASPSPSVTSGNSESAGDSSSFQPSSKGSEPSPAREPKRRMRRCPDGFELNETGKKLCVELRVNWAVEGPKFRDYEYKDPKSDWQAAARTWIRRAADTSRVGLPPPRQDPRAEQQDRNAEHEAARARDATRRYRELVGGQQ